ncbi:MAG TPA: TadE family protein, partial [Myxococcaceae bacterium]|nr:TadE family protein [Myxococcaceae bacterium]
MRHRRPATRRAERGQAAVESALTLPLTVFLMLGTLQLFLMLQGRIMAEYAAFRAVRAGSVRHGDCQAMTHAAILA